MNSIANKRLHDVEKQVIAEKLYNQCWEYYQHSVYGAMLAQAGIARPPRLLFICKGIGTAGFFYPRHRLYGECVVEINTAYYVGNSMECNRTLNTTIAHELAHFIAYKLFPNAQQWHGPEFRSIMQSIGYSGDTFHSMKKRDAIAVASKSRDDLFEF